MNIKTLVRLSKFVNLSFQKGKTLNNIGRTNVTQIMTCIGLKHFSKIGKIYNIHMYKTLITKLIKICMYRKNDIQTKLIKNTEP